MAGSSASMRSRRRPGLGPGPLPDSDRGAKGRRPRGWKRAAATARLRGGKWEGRPRGARELALAGARPPRDLRQGIPSRSQHWPNRGSRLLLEAAGALPLPSPLPGRRSAGAAVLLARSAGGLSEAHGGLGPPGPGPGSPPSTRTRGARGPGLTRPGADAARALRSHPRGPGPMPPPPPSRTKPLGGGFSEAATASGWCWLGGARRDPGDSALLQTRQRAPDAPACWPGQRFTASRRRKGGWEAVCARGRSERRRGAAAAGAAVPRAPSPAPGPGGPRSLLLSRVSPGSTRPIRLPPRPASRRATPSPAPGSVSRPAGVHDSDRRAVRRRAPLPTNGRGLNLAGQGRPEGARVCGKGGVRRGPGDSDSKGPASPARRDAGQSPSLGSMRAIFLVRADLV